MEAVAVGGGGDLYIVGCVNQGGLVFLRQLALAKCNNGNALSFLSSVLSVVSRVFFLPVVHFFFVAFLLFNFFLVTSNSKSSGVRIGTGSTHRRGV